jgi:uncharacterized membrane protein
MTEDLPPLQRQYGERLEILTLDVTTQQGVDLYDAAVLRFAIPADRLGVPTLVVGDVVLVGSGEIPEQLPGLVKRMLASGGSDWAAIPGLVDPAGAPDAGAPDAVGDEALVAAALGRAARDPLGSAAAIAVLVGLLCVLVWSSSLLWRTGALHPERPSGLIPLIALLGLGVAAYLAVVETSGSAAVCGPIGDCNRVHESGFARFLGIFPVAVLGLLGYLAILATWLAGRIAGGAVSRTWHLGLVALAAAGTVFSIYLTFLEPFVIGATCAWCLASAVMMGALLVLSANPRPSVRHHAGLRLASAGPKFGLSNPFARRSRSGRAASPPRRLRP